MGIQNRHLKVKLISENVSDQGEGKRLCGSEVPKKLECICVGMCGGCPKATRSFSQDILKFFTKMNSKHHKAFLSWIKQV